MSRIGNKPIQIPSGVKCEVSGSHIKVVGPKGSLARDVRPEIDIVEEGNTLLIKGKDNSKRTNAFRGMTRSLIDNMIVGSEKGFQKKLIVEGVGYRVKVEGDQVTLNVGYSNPVDFKLPKDVSATAENNVVTLDSINKELLGLTAAKIRDIRKPEPYKGKGIRYADEHIIRKVGKAAGKK
jgi:large subunit ribosomal protein L6